MLKCFTGSSWKPSTSSVIDLSGTAQESFLEWRCDLSLREEIHSSSKLDKQLVPKSSPGFPASTF